MPWSRTPQALENARTLEELKRAVSQELQALHQVHKAYERIGPLTYGPSVQVPGETDRQVYLTVTDGLPFTIENPARPREGVRLTFVIENASGGIMGAITWGSEYEFTSAFVPPPIGGRALIEFHRTF